MYTLADLDRVLNLHAKGRLVSEITQITGISTSTVKLMIAGKWGKRLLAKKHYDGGTCDADRLFLSPKNFNPGYSKSHRCPGCGGLIVTTVCLKCELDKLKEEEAFLQGKSIGKR